MIENLFEFLHRDILATSWLEIIAVSFGILSVWFARKANILVYPTGIVSVLIYVYICFFAKLYAHMSINMFYFAMSVYGWYNWTRKDENQKVIPISWNTPKQQWVAILAVITGYAVIFALIWIFKHDDLSYIRSFVPFVDSFTSAVFLVGMLLMARKKIENWLYWIIGNSVSIPLYFSLGLVMTSVQYIVFLGLAVLGYYEWRKLYRKQ
ncbi:MAG TPA: nicotinamide riboside transporter PnuC [Bacteroidales bacterium]|nr:nicotinamide riboside transporter PnuC [Bacteroidales bacterium]